MDLFDIAVAKKLAGGGGGGGGGLTLLAEQSLGQIKQTSSTPTVVCEITPIESVSDYDLLIAVAVADSGNDSAHLCTVGFHILSTDGTGYPDYIGTKTIVASLSNRIQFKKDSSGDISTKQSGDTAGVYLIGSISNDTFTAYCYKAYKSSVSGSINDTYTLKIYGVKIYELFSS